MIGAIAQITEDSLNEVVGLQALVPNDLIIRLATIAESHVDRLLSLMISDSTVTGNAFMTSVIEEFRHNFHQTWSARHSWLKRGFGIDVAPAAEAQALESLVDARNAIVHGGGTLTNLQSRDTAKRISLERGLAAHLEITIAGRQLQYSNRTSPRAITIVREYLLAIDNQLIGAPRIARTSSLFR